MSKTVKIIIVVILVAVIAFFVYKYAKKAKTSQSPKAPGAAPAAPAMPATGEALARPIGETTNPKAILPGDQILDIKSGGLNVSDMSNGTAPDTAIARPPAEAPVIQAVVIPQSPESTPELVHITTGEPVVSDMSNGTDPDQLTRL